jgi:hypothetical protein
MLEGKPRRFIGEPLEVEFDQAPRFVKKPGCPDRFIWRGQRYQVVELLAEWRDYSRRGRSSRNMRPERLSRAAQHGSWGVGRAYFRVRTGSGQIFDIYYDRAPKGSEQRQGSWFLYREMNEETL